MDWWQCESVKSQDKTQNWERWDAASQSGIIIHRVWRPSRNENILRRIYMRMEWTRTEKREIWSIRLGSHVRCLSRWCISFHLNNCRQKKKTNKDPTYVIVSTCELFAYDFEFQRRWKRNVMVLHYSSKVTAARAADGSTNGRDKVFRKFNMKASLNISAANHVRLKLCSRARECFLINIFYSLWVWQVPSGTNYNDYTK